MYTKNVDFKHFLVLSDNVGVRNREADQADYHVTSQPDIQDIKSKMRNYLSLQLSNPRDTQSACL